MDNYDLDTYVIPALHPSEIHRHTITIEQSHFIIHIAHTPTPESAKFIIEKIKNEFRDATHNCWACIACPPGQTTYMGYSDDGEPRGTAGKPMLQILRYSNIGEITAITTRYFGGIKLGKSGLVRAYQQTVQLGLETLPLQPYVIPITLEVVVGYEHITALLSLLSDLQVSIIKKIFTTDASYTIVVSKHQLQHLQKNLIDLTKGNVLFIEKS